jgi:photosystem II stability/assembly factor-like uncharacterized protein
MVMRVLRISSGRTSTCVGVLAVALLGAWSCTADGQQATSAPPAETRTYDSIVTRRAEAPTPTAARPLLVVGGRRAFAVVGGVVYATDDAGATWERRGSTGGDAVAAAAIGDEWRCLLRTGQVVSSRDGGRSWTRAADLATLADSGSRVAAGGFGPDGEGWAALDGARPALVASVGGAWRRIEGPRGRIIAGWRSGGALVALAGGEVYRGAADGPGLLRVATLQGATLADVAFADEQRGWIATAEGLVLETNDGGTTWLPRPVAGAPSLEAVGLADRCFWVLGRADRSGALYVSGDGGVRWRSALVADAPLSRPVRLGDAVWLVDGAGALWSATAVDGTWRRVGALTSGVGAGKRRPRD